MAAANLEKGLAKYYKTLNQPYDGIFAAFIEENGFDEEDIKGEMESNAEDCTILEFHCDDDGNNIFPLHPPIQDETARNEEIFRIMKIAYYHGVKAVFAEVNAKPFDIKLLSISSQEIATAEEAYCEQLKCLKPFINTEPDLMYYLAVGKNDDLPFLTYMIDAFTRDKTHHFVETNEAWKVIDFCSKNKFMKRLQTTKQRLSVSLKAAMDSYCNRIMNVLQYQPLFKVNDSITKIAGYVCGVAKLINILINSRAAKVPFQIDLLIAVQNVESVTNTASAELSDDDETEEEDDEEIDEEKSSKDESIEIGNVESKLRGSNCGYHKFEITNQLKQDYDRRFNEEYQNFRAKLKKKKTPKDTHRFDDKTYPQNKRFIVFIDRRKNQNQNDEITFFEPPSVCDTLPHKHVPEWYFESLRQCMIPRKGFGDGTGEKQHNNKKNTKPDDKTITATDGLNGELMTFSFHIEEANERRCYIVWNGQTSRFHGEFIKTLLPLLFVESDAKNKFIKSPQTTKLIKEFDKAVIDVKFENFYKSLR